MERQQPNHKSKKGSASPMLLIVGFIAGLVLMSLALAVLGMLLPM